MNLFIECKKRKGKQRSISHSLTHSYTHTHTHTGSEDARDFDVPEAGGVMEGRVTEDVLHVGIDLPKIKL
jgi:hypothetical protein